MADEKAPDELTLAQIGAWTSEDVLAHFNAVAAVKERLYAPDKHVFYHSFLADKDGQWLLKADKMALKDEAREWNTVDGQGPIFDTTLRCKTFIKIVVEADLRENPPPVEEVAPQYVMPPRPVAQPPPMVPYDEARADVMVQAMHDAGVRLLCFDFDLTLVAQVSETPRAGSDVHDVLTGIWRRTCMAIARSSYHHTAESSLPR